MDGMNPFMGMDPQMLMRLLSQGGMGGGGVPGAIPNQAAAGAAMPGAAGIMQPNPQSADRLQKLGTLFKAMGAMQQPYKGPSGPGGGAPQAPQAPAPQMPQMGGGAMQRLPMQMPVRPPQMPQVGPGMMGGGMGMGGRQVPPADIMQRVLASLSQYGG